MHFQINLYFPQFEKTRLIDFNLLFESFGNVGTLDSSCGQHSKLRRGFRCLGTHYVWKGTEKSQSRWLGNWLTGRSPRGRKVHAEKQFPVFKMRSTKRESCCYYRKKFPGYHLLKFLFHCRFLRCCLLSQLLLGTTTQNVFVFSPWHNHFGLFPNLLGFSGILFQYKYFLRIIFYASFLPINCCRNCC